MFTAMTVHVPVSPAAVHLARLQALAEPTRLQIVDLLRGGERCVCDLTDALEAAQSRLSFHLKVLKDAGLVTDRRDGRWVYYTLNQDTLEELAERLSRPAAAWVRQAECCG
jgi:ArsR family transcriptional regulator